MWEKAFVVIVSGAKIHQIERQQHLNKAESEELSLVKS